MGIYGNDAGSGAASKPPAAPTTASPTSTTETNSYKPTYSRENSFVGSDTGTTGGANWRSRVYGNDTDSSAVSKPPTAPITVSPTSTTSVTPSALRSRATTNSINSTDTNTNSITNSTTNKDANSLPQIRLAIDKLTQDAKNENSTKKPEGLSPNAIKVLPTFNGSALNSKNKAPADFSSGEEESDDENNKKSENNVQSSNSKEKIN